MSNSFDVINQGLVLVSALICLYQSFVSLNSCNKDTHWSIRLPLVIILPASVGLAIYITNNHVPHWSFTFISIGLAVKLLSDRRRVAPITVTPKLKSQ